MRFLRNIIKVAIAVPTEPCSLLVPNAASGGRPLITSAGKVISPPPPAKVSIKPAKIPTRNKKPKISTLKPNSSNVI